MKGQTSLSSWVQWRPHQRSGIPQLVPDLHPTLSKRFPGWASKNCMGYVLYESWSSIQVDHQNIQMGGTAGEWQCHLILRLKWVLQWVQKIIHPCTCQFSCTQPTWIYGILPKKLIIIWLLRWVPWPGSQFRLHQPKDHCAQIQKGPSPQIQNAVATMASRRPSDSNSNPSGWYDMTQTINENWVTNEAFASS